MMKGESEQGVRRLPFTKVADYTTFLAEYALRGDDLVFHFFAPPESAGQEAQQTEWRKKFAPVLSAYAQEFWDAGYPRLQAAYTEEVRSWWFCAYGFAGGLTAETRALKFLEGLDARLDQARTGG